MEQILTTAQQVIELAFAETEYMPASAVSPADIAVAEERYVVPVTGRQLYRKMLEGEYPLLRDEYAAPVAALFTRLGMQAVTDVRSGRFGTVVPRSEFCQPAERQQLLDLRKSILRKARALQRRLSDHLELNRSDYPEYRPEDNILNRCSTDGGFLQMR
ncbi:MAG: hypothetical protein J1E04_04060 [Alistipes sp.]|nr:hypothetical protein [Alistipes sp.]